MAIRDAVQSLGIEVRAGLHTGECELRGDDIGGVAVHFGARVSALAGPNEVLVFSTLRDLVIGSGLEFEDRGAHELKGGEIAAGPRSQFRSSISVSVVRPNSSLLSPRMPTIVDFAISKPRFPVFRRSMTPSMPSSRRSPA